MPNDRRTSLAISCLVAVLLGQAGPASALEPGLDGQEPPAASAPAEAPDDEAPEDDADPQPVEPEYRLINIPTTALLPRYRLAFDLTHRFAGNLAQGSFSTHAKNLFGLDQGALIGLEVRFAVARRVHTAIYRSSLDKTIQLHGKYDAIRQQGSPSPVSISAILSVEGADNFTDRFSPAVGAVVSRTVRDTLAVYAAPIWVHNSASHLTDTRDTFVLGLGGRLKVRPTIFLVGEISPRLSGYDPGRPEFGFGIETRVGGHLFQLNFTNTFSTTYGQVARGGFADSLYLGFNLARKFY
jgi:hypothetical protein